MTITKRVRQQMLDGDAEDAVLIRLEPHPAHVGKAGTPDTSSTSQAAQNGDSGSNDAVTAAGGRPKSGQAWSAAEHERFLEALVMYPSGPWKLVAAHVGTRTTRQTMTHAQKYRQKIERQRRRSSQQQQQQQQQLLHGHPTASTEEADGDAAMRARAAMLTLQQAADVFHAASSDGGPAGGDRDATRSSNTHLSLPVPRRLSEASARSLMLSESSKVSQAVVSLIQLAEPTAAAERKSAPNAEPISRKPASAATVPSA